MEIFIPIINDDKCILTKGQNVDFDTPFLEQKAVSDVKISVSSKLQISPDKIFKYLKKFVGDEVKKGDLLAEKKTLLSRRSVKSDLSGRVREINHFEGNLIISANDSKPRQVPAYFKGEVGEILSNGIKLKVKDVKDFELKNSSKTIGGKCIYIKSRDSTLAMNVDFSTDKILVIGSISPYLQRKAEVLGIKALITLKSISIDPHVPQAQIKDDHDFAKILTLSLPYCFVDKQSSRIYFYN